MEKPDRPRKIVHPFPPLFDARSRILILGSFPSVKSRERNFFYAHPQNRFWPLMAALFGEAVPSSVPEKEALILSHHLALWDVIRSCTVAGSSDAGIRDAEPNDLRIILDRCPIERIACNGQKSFQLYRRFLEPVLGMEALCLPSTSPANARWTLESLTAAWSVLRTADEKPDPARSFFPNPFATPEKSCIIRDDALRL